MKKLIVGNWKMNPTRGTDARKLFKSVNATASKLKNTETVVCPPLVYLESLGELVTTRSCVLGSQDAFWEHAGAYTGQVSADMIFGTKARYVIVGHSERRAMGETDEMVSKKIKSILQFPLIPIVCVGETKRDDDHAYVKLVKNQIKSALADLTQEEIARIVIAYEPVWAIGKNAKKACEPSDCREMAHVIKTVLADISNAEIAKAIPILYGGSANAENAEPYLKDGLVDGLLVGRASLDAKEFIKILKIAEKN
ncbi:MAG: triosephosphate isomerase, triosephosphate isomerase [Patescibacteria group bacterium]|nr:triosephosphate isomerase, triosephosphate isomerase [Patescibacteria group bacterium]